MSWLNHSFLYIFGFVFGLIGAIWLATNPTIPMGFTRLTALISGLFGILCIGIAISFSTLEETLTKKIKGGLNGI